MKHKLTISTLLLLALFLTLAPTIMASTATWYVNGVRGNDSNNCKSPTAACKTIGHAIVLALSGDTVTVAAATYSENLTISRSLKITGSGARTTIIDGGGHGSVVRISSTGANVTLSNMTIRNGSDGGVVFFGGSGGGISNTGTLTVNSGTISGNRVGASRAYSVSHGGGIYNGGTLTINRSTISGNSASGIFLARSYGVGGGIYNAGTLTVNNSTISANYTGPGTAFGGNYGFGGGIYNAGTLTVNNSTISPNISSWPSGGIYGPATLQNSIVANGELGNCAGAMTSKGYNLSDDGTCNFSSKGDWNNTDPMLVTLGNNGGPTQTMALLPGSPAIDAGNPSGCTDGLGHLLTTDQRGYPYRRPDSEDKTDPKPRCDMGAYERQSD